MTTSEVMALACYPQKLNIRASSRVAKQLKT